MHEWEFGMNDEEIMEVDLGANIYPIYEFMYTCRYELSTRCNNILPTESQGELVSALRVLD